MNRFILASILFFGLAACSNAAEDDLASLARGQLIAFEVHDAPIAASTAAFLDESGAPVTIADFSGRVVLLNVWATWCAPCVREMPQLDALQGEYGSDDFVVITVSTDRIELAEVEYFLREEIGAAHLALYTDQSLDFALGSGVSVWPTTILYNRGGMELGRIAGPAEWNSDDAHRFIEAAIALGQE